MNWKELLITVNTSDLDKASSIAQMAAGNGLYIEDYSTLENDVLSISSIDLIEEELLNKNKKKSIIHLYLNELDDCSTIAQYIDERMQAECIHYQLCEKTIKEEDWAENWKQYYKPFTVGQKLLVKPEWETAPPHTGRKIVRIVPGMAFGTGTHESTRMCLELIEKYTKKDMSVLDIGCGSGILMTAALLLGAKYGMGVDLDPLAVKIARENLALNGFSEEQYSVHEGNLLKPVSGSFALICANIVADVIASICTDVKKHIETDGVFITSGIINQKMDEVLHALKEADFHIIEVLKDKDWVAIAATPEANNA